MIGAVFVADGPAMLAQGLILASSLRTHAPPGLVLTAMLPQGAHPAPDKDIRAAYARMDVTLQDMAVPGDLWAKPYPHGNKILACCAAPPADLTVFFDTDMLATAPLMLDNLTPPGGIAAVPEGKPTWGRESDRWARVYAHFGLDLPTDRVRLTRGKRREFLPYFNAGFIAFTGDFAARWRETARVIDHDVSVARKRPWLDQIALPVTCARHGVPVTVLDETWNYSISDRQPEPAAPLIVHYHRYAHNHGWPFYDPAYHALRARGPIPDWADRLLCAGLTIPDSRGADA